MPLIWMPAHLALVCQIKDNKRGTDPKWYASSMQACNQKMDQFQHLATTVSKCRCLSELPIPGSGLPAPCPSLLTLRCLAACGKKAQTTGLTHRAGFEILRAATVLWPQLWMAMQQWQSSSPHHAMSSLTSTLTGAPLAVLGEHAPCYQACS
jgi:hypothetical protein